MAVKKKNEKKKTNINAWMYSILGIFVVLIIVAMVISQPKTSVNLTDDALGEIVQVDSAEHVPDGTDPGPYYSNPPAGGKHYANPLPAGFYEDTDPEAQVTYPEGALVHSLEHGYVIFWYNCQVSDNCETLKSQIKSVMDEFSSVKLIAFPWPDMDVPLAMTSWGRLLDFPAVDLDTMRAFVRNNRNKSPEPNVQ
jgi:hypothetical protein